MELISGLLHDILYYILYFIDSLFQMTDNLSYKAGFNDMMRGNVLFVSDEGELMSEYCAGGARYTGCVAPIQWNTLSMLETFYYEKCHKYLLENYLPHLYESFYHPSTLNCS